MNFVRAPISRWGFWFALGAATAGALACLWVAWCEFPLYWWNEMRLAPAFGLRLGLNPYPPLNGGPLFTWIYGPIGILINLPATLAASPLNALRIACGINALTIIAPIAWYFFASAELRSRGTKFAWLALAGAILLVPRMNLVLYVPDHCAIAAGLLANWCLARRDTPAGWWLVLAAAATALAAWSKQIEVLLPAAQIGYMWIRRQRTVLLQYAGWLALFHLVALAIFSGVFGWSNLWLNLVAIPGRLGWANLLDRLSFRPWILAGQLGVPAAGILLLWRFRRWPTAGAESIRLFQLGMLSFWTMLPIGLVAFFKVGGDINLLHSWDYLMPALLLVWLSRDWPISAKPLHLSLVVTVALVVHATDFIGLPAKPFTQHLRFAAQLAAKHPGGIWFPQNPVVGYYADRTLWHTEDGVQTRFLAGYGVNKNSFLKYLPPHLEALAYPASNTAPFSLPLLSELSQKTRIPYWVVYTKPSRD